MKSASIHSRFSFILSFAAMAAAALFLGACQTTNPAPSTPPSATVKIKEWSAAYYGSATAGNGSLNFQGQTYPFSISGIGAGGMGGQHIKASGKVYNLNNISDFSGTFRGASSGLTLIEGTMHAKLVNQNGVVMYVKGETEGLASSVGVQAFQVTLNK